MPKTLFGALLIIIGLCVSIFWIYPMWNDVSDIKGKKIEIQATLDRVSSLEKKRNEIQAQFNSISPEDLARLKEFLPKNPESGLLILGLDKVASSNGMILKGFEMDEGKASSPAASDQDEKDFSEFPFQVLSSGSYESFLSFLTSLEKSRRLIDIDRLSFESGSTDEAGKVVKSNFYEYTLSAHAYWKK